MYRITYEDGKPEIERRTTIGFYWMSEVFDAAKEWLNEKLEEGEDDYAECADNIKKLQDFDIESGMRTPGGETKIDLIKEVCEYLNEYEGQGVKEERKSVHEKTAEWLFQQFDIYDYEIDDFVDSLDNEEEYW